MKPKKQTTATGKKSYTKTHAFQKRAEKSKQYALECLKKTYGNVSLTCEKVGLSRMTFYKWRSEDPEFNRQVEEINERTLDFVESKLLQGIQDGNVRLIMFYLNAKGKQRGYGLKNETEGDKSGSVMIQISSEEADF